MKKLMTLLALFVAFCSVTWGEESFFYVTVNLPKGNDVSVYAANGQNEDGTYKVDAYYDSWSRPSIYFSCPYGDKYVAIVDYGEGEEKKASILIDGGDDVNVDGDCTIDIEPASDYIYVGLLTKFDVDGEFVYHTGNHGHDVLIKKGSDVQIKEYKSENSTNSNNLHIMCKDASGWYEIMDGDLQDDIKISGIQELVNGYMIQSNIENLTSTRPDSLFNITPKNVSNNVGDESELPYTYVYRVLKDGGHRFHAGTDFQESVKPVYMSGSPQGGNDGMLSGNSTEEVYGGDIVLYQKAKDPTYYRIDLPTGRWGDLFCEVSSQHQTEIPDVLSFYDPSRPFYEGNPKFYYVKDGAMVKVTDRGLSSNPSIKTELEFNGVAIQNGNITVSSGENKVDMILTLSVPDDYKDYVGCHNVSVEYTGQTIDGWIVKEGDDYCDIYGYVGKETEVEVPNTLNGKRVYEFHPQGFNGTSIKKLIFKEDSDERIVSIQNYETITNQGSLETVFAATYEIYSMILRPSQETNMGVAEGVFGNAKIVLDPNKTKEINDLILYPDGNEDSNGIPTYTLIGVAEDAGLVVRRHAVGTDYHITAVGPMMPNDNVIYFGLTGDKDVYYDGANFIQMTSLRGLCLEEKKDDDNYYYYSFSPYPGVNIGEKVDLFGSAFRNAYDKSVFDALVDISEVFKDAVEYDKENDILTAKVSNNTNIGDVATFVNSGISLVENINISLVEDIDLTESATPQTWSQIGTSENPFTGIFDGAGHSLNVGEIAGSLFGTIGHEAELGEEDPAFGIKDLSVIISEAAADVKQGVDSDDMLEKYFGLLAQNNYGTISNVIASGLIYLANDEDAKNAVATLIANNEGVMDHVVGFFGTEEETANKASIIVIQNMGRGRTKGRVSKSASNGKAKGNATISYEPNEAEIKLNYRLYTDEEFASGEPAYWLNFDGEGYSGNFNGEWAKGSKHPVKAVADGQGAAVRISYEVEGREENEVNVKGAFFANDKTGLKLDYDIKPDAIKINGSVVDSDPASGSAVVSLASGARNNKGEMVVTLHYNATGVKDIEADKKNSAVKTLENGRVVIIRDGKKYDLAGRVVE